MSECFPKAKFFTNLVNNTTLNAIVNVVKGKISSITNLATTALTTAKNKIPSVSNLVKKTHYNTKFSEIEKKLLIMIMINILLL